MVQLVKSRISSCKTTCSWRRARRGHRRLRGGGRDLALPRGIAPRRRPSVIHFTALSILILRNSFGERASDGRSRSSVNGCHTWRGRGEPRAEPRGARECGALSCPRWPDAIRPFPYPPPLQSFSPLRRKERRLPSVRPFLHAMMAYAQTLREKDYNAATSYETGARTGWHGAAVGWVDS